MELVLSAVGLGLLLAFLVGPVFFTIIQTSLDVGFKSGVLVALGVILSDIAYILLVYFGLSELITDNLDWVKIVGGGIFIVFGVILLIENIRKKGVKKVFDNEKMSRRGFVFKGFAVNGLSPFVPIFWIATIGTLKAKYNSDGEIIIFLLITIVTVFITDTFKVRLADKLSNLVTTRFVKILKTTAGIIFVAAGIRILFI